MNYNSKSRAEGARPLDYLYLYLLCFREGVFHSANRAFRNARGHCRNTLFGSLARFGLFWYELLAKIYVVLFPIFLVFTVYYLIRSLFFGEFWTRFWWFVIAIVFTWLVVDWNNLGRVKNYFRSAWWHNTGIRPRSVWKDAGTRGEWIATGYIEEEFLKAGLNAQIHNRLLIPKSQHKELAFTEADIIAVTELGIFTFEVKNYTGHISGILESEYWEAQYEDMAYPMYNPFLQNQGHINYLAEYLYRTDRELFSAERMVNEYFSNIVIFSNTLETMISLGGVGFKKAAWFTTVRIDEEKSLQKRLRELGSVRLSPEEIAAFSKALLPMTDYTTELYDSIISEKADVEERDRRDKELNPNSSRYEAALYSAARFSNGKVFILRKNSDSYISAAETKEDLFKELPEFYELKIEKQTEWLPGLAGLKAADSARLNIGS